MNNPPITGFPESDSYLFNLSLGLPDITSNSLSVRSDNAIVDSNNNVISYLNQYMHIKYADDNIGTNISNSPTNKAYFGLFNSTSGTESTAPADYTWYLVSGGFGTTNYLWYVVPGGRRFSYYIGPSAPSYLYSVDAGTAVNLDIISSADGSSARICYAKSSSSSLASTPTSVTVAGNTTYPATNTWGGSEVWVATAPSLSANEYLYQSDGVYNPTTGFTTWNVPYLSNLKVGQLSAISADLGSITAGEISIGTSPAISGTTMTGTGAHIYSDGRMVVGNSSKNINWNNSTLTINGNVISTGNISSSAVSTTSQMVGSTPGPSLWPSTGNTYSYYTNVSTITNFDLSKPIFIFVNVNVGIETSSVGNASAPTYAMYYGQLQYSTDNGSTYSNLGVQAKTFITALQATSISGSNRLFYSTSGLAQQYVPTTAFANIKFRIQNNFTSYQNVTGTLGTWCAQDLGLYPPGGYGQVYDYTAVTITTIQLKV